jgi:Ca2+-transporting ATPase
MTAAAFALFSLRDDQTIVVTTIVLFQVVYLLALATWPNPWAIAGICAVLALQAAFVYLPPLQAVFGTVALGPGALAQAGAAAVVLLPAIAVEEAVRRRYAPPGTA